MVRAILSFHSTSSPTPPQRRHPAVISGCLEVYHLSGLTRLRVLRIPMLVMAAVSWGIIFLAWLYLFKLAGWGESDKPFVRTTYTPRHLLLRLTNSPIQMANAETSSSRVWTRLAVFGITAAMVYLAGTEIYFLYSVLDFRRKAAARGIIAAAFEKENEWGLGQVIAVFSWAPLLIELASAAINTFRNKDPPCRCASCDQQWPSVVECKSHQQQGEAVQILNVVARHAVTV